VFILTSNAVPAERALGFGARARQGSAWRDKLLEVFRPELLNRIDAVIPFGPLDREDLVEIVRLLLAGVERRLAARGFNLRVERAAMEWLAAVGDDGVSGARALRRAVEQQVEAALSPLLLRKEFAPGSTVVIDANDAGLVFSKTNAPTPDTDANPAPH
jgi:ATP-dependent Clp protease ATP-binding subunit ClpA